MYENDINKLVELIYESAIEPSKWTDLLNALAEFVDQVESQSNIEGSEGGVLSILPSINAITQTEKVGTTTSISETLKSLSEINDESENQPQITQANDLLLGHFARAIKIAKRLVDVDEQHNVVLSLLDRMPIALVLVDAQAQVIETNALAEEMLSMQEGFKVKNNLLDAGNKNNKRVYDVIHKMSKHDSVNTRGQSLSITNEKTKNNIMLYITPLRQQGSNQKASAAVFISQRKSHAIIIPKSFSANYSLTNKESEVTEQLVRGLSIKEIAADGATTENTVRSQVKSILKKTNTSRQAELISLVYNGIGEFTNPPLYDDGSDSKKILQKSTLSKDSYDVLKLRDGRNMAFAEYGDLSGTPVFFLHSVFGCRLELAFHSEEICQQKSVRLIIMDRPGYGASDHNSDTTFINWVQDLVELADHLKIDKFSIIGYVMGGMYALACAHEIPHRINNISIVTTGMVPKTRSDYESIIPLYKMNYRMAKYLPKIYCMITGVFVKGILSDPSSFFEQFMKYLEEADKKVLKSDKYRKQIFTALIEGFRSGGKSASTELIQFMHDWEFDPANITRPINIWHGTSDHHIPSELGRRFAEHIKDTKLFLKEGQGHYMIYTHWSEILDQLLGQEQSLTQEDG